MTCDHTPSAYLLSGAYSLAVSCDQVRDHVEVWKLCWRDNGEVDVELMDVSDGLGKRGENTKGQERGRGRGSCRNKDVTSRVI